VLGTIVNTLSIIVGSLIGLLFKGGIPEKYRDTLLHGMGLAVVLIGLKTALATDGILTVIISLALGSWIGERMRIEDRVDQLGNWIGRRVSKDGPGSSTGVVSARLLRPCMPNPSSTGSVRCCLHPPWASAFFSPPPPFWSIRASSR